MWALDHVLEINHPADIKGFLSDVKPALLSALDTEYEKNPFEVCCVRVTVWKMLTYCDFDFHRHQFGSIIRVLLLLRREQFEFWRRLINVSSLQEQVQRLYSYQATINVFIQIDI